MDSKIDSLISESYKENNFIGFWLCYFHNMGVLAAAAPWYCSAVTPGLLNLSLNSSVSGGQVEGGFV